MGRKCFVPNCGSNHKTCSKGVSLFRVPRDPARFEQWRRAMPRTDKLLEQTDFVCIKHFPEHMISRKYYSELNGRVLLDVPKKPVLTADAVPRIFSDLPKYDRENDGTPAERTTAATEASQRCHPGRLGEDELSVPNKTEKRKPPLSGAANRTRSSSDSRNEARDANATKPAETAVVVSPVRGPDKPAATKLSGVWTHFIVAAPTTELACAQSEANVRPRVNYECRPETPPDDLLQGSPLVIKREAESSCSSASPSADDEKHMDLVLSGSFEQWEPSGQSNGPTEQCSQEERKPLAFSLLSKCASKLALPTTAWAVQVVDRLGTEAVIFAEATLPKNPDQPPFQRKILRLTPSNDGSAFVKTFIYGRPVIVDGVSSGELFSALSDAQDAIVRFDNVRVCPGGPDTEKYNGLELECAYVDAGGSWRHQACTLVTTRSRCEACRRLKDTLRVHAARQKSKGKKMHGGRVCATPDTLEARVELMQKARTANSKSRDRLFMRNKVLKVQIGDCKAKLRDIN